MNDAFYLPENPAYTVVDSARDSVRFVLKRALTTYNGKACAKGSFLDPNGDVMEWHDFGPLEGPGWAANAIGGAWELYRWGRLTRDAQACAVALSLVDHVLDDGFIEWETGFIYPYRHTLENRFCLNFKHRDDWLCPGSLAKVAYQLYRFASSLEGRRAFRMRSAAWGFAHWLTRTVPLSDNGWMPRRVTRKGEPYPFRAEGGLDPFVDTSADGLFALQLLAELGSETGEFHPWTASLADAFVEGGGFFGSINHDTYDAQENVAYAVAFRVFRRLAELWQADAYRQFAYDACLKPLERYWMTDDRNGVPTKGLLWMEPSWDTAYLWENAEASLAYLEAYDETHNEEYLRNALTILRAIAKHHHGEYGFLTEGVDWNNHVGRQHHFDDAEFGDIRYTEPLLNHLHHVEPLCFYLERHARQRFLSEEGILLLEI